MKRLNTTIGLALFAAGVLSLPLAAAAQETSADAILPVTGSLRGGFGSVFKTSAQLHNRTDRAARGVLVFHPAGVSASAGDPSVAYDLAPRSTTTFDDVIAAMGAAGIGSIDVIVAEGAVPAVVARIYDDQPAGTSGAGVRLVDPDDALVAGDTSTLIVPGDLARTRFNVGIRTLEAGAELILTVWSESGMQRASIRRMFPPNFFQQQAAADFVSAALLANDSISIEVAAGSAILYGTTTDNTTNDPAIQIAGRDAVAPEEQLDEN